MHLQMPQRFQEQWARHSLSLQETQYSLPAPAIANTQLPVTPPPQLPLVTFEQEEEQEQEQPSSASSQPRKYLSWRLFASVMVLALMAVLYFIWHPTTAATSSASIFQQNVSSTVSISRTPSSASTSGTDSATIQVYIVGAVKHPGVYTLEGGARIYQLIQAAGGPLPDANLVALNLAAKLSDGQEVYVSRLGEVPPTYVGGAPQLSGNAMLVNINTASVDELRQKLNVSSQTAQAIVNYRLQHGDFTSVEQLLQVLSKATYDKIKDLVTVS